MQALLAVRELLNLRDLTLLGLEVASLQQQFPDVRCGGRGRGGRRSPGGGGRG